MSLRKSLAVPTAVALAVGFLAIPARAGQSQTISFDPLESVDVNESTVPQAEATSGLPVTFTSETPENCVYQYPYITARQARTCTVTATQPGDGTWDPAPPVTRSVTMQKGAADSGLLNHPLVYPVDEPVDFGFGATPARTWEGQALPTGIFGLRVQTESGALVDKADLPIDPDSGQGEWTINDPPGGIKPGWYVAFACYRGDDNYLAAGSDCGAMGSPFQLYRKASQTVVTVTPDPSKYGEKVTISASVTDAAGKSVGTRGRVIFEWVAPDGGDGAEASVVDGKATVRARLSRNKDTYVFGQFDDPTAEYGDSWQEVRPRVLKGDQTITFTPPYDLTVGDDQVLVVDTASDLDADVETTTPEVCSIEDVPGGVGVTALALGTCSIIASQPGDEDWNAADPVTRSFDVVRHTAHLSYPDGRGVVGAPLAKLTPTTDMTGTLRFTAAGLPEGLTITGPTGVISGTPTSATDGPQAVAAVVRNGDGQSTGTTFTIRVEPSPIPPQVMYPNGKGWRNRSFTLRPTAVGFEGPVRYRVSEPDGPSPTPSNGLPTGLQVDPTTGAIVGTPVVTGRFTPRIIATDGTSTVTTKVRITVEKGKPTPLLRYPTGKGVVGVPLATLYPHTNGLGRNVRFTASGLPRGLTVKSASGRIVGTPQRSGKRTAQVTARGSRGTARTSVSIRIKPSPMRPGLSYPDLRLRRGRPMAPVKPVVVGLTGRTRFSATGVPRGLTAAKGSGKITGTPKRTGSFTATVRVHAAAGGKARDRVAIEVGR